MPEDRHCSKLGSVCFFHTIHINMPCVVAPTDPTFEEHNCPSRVQVGVGVKGCLFGKCPHFPNAFVPALRVPSDTEVG